MAIAKHILGCVSGVGALVAAYFGYGTLLIVLCLITCLLCWEHIDFVRTSTDGIIRRVLVFIFAHWISSFFAPMFGFDEKIMMWVLCDVAFLIMNISSLFLVL